jgi:hypothetical protein
MFNQGITSMRGFGITKTTSWDYNADQLHPKKAPSSANDNDHSTLLRD